MDTKTQLDGIKAAIRHLARDFEKLSPHSLGGATLHHVNNLMAGCADDRWFDIKPTPVATNPAPPPPLVTRPKTPATDVLNFGCKVPEPPRVRHIILPSGGYMSPCHYSWADSGQKDVIRVKFNVPSLPVLLVFDFTDHKETGDLLLTNDEKKQINQAVLAHGGPANWVGSNVKVTYAPSETERLAELARKAKAEKKRAERVRRYSDLGRKWREKQLAMNSRPKIQVSAQQIPDGPLVPISWCWAKETSDRLPNDSMCGSYREEPSYQITTLHPAVHYRVHRPAQCVQIALSSREYEQLVEMWNAAAVKEEAHKKRNPPK